MFDFERSLYTNKRKELESKGYIFKVSSDGYQVWHKEEYITGASVMLPRQKGTRRSLKMKQADYYDYLRNAVQAAERHETTH